jgi:DNA-binding Lrp family transcriptional regulator
MKQEEELIPMSQKERDRLKVLQEARNKAITQKEAAERIGVSERRVRKLMTKLRKEGDRAVAHGLRGRSSNRKIGEEVRERVLAWVREEYRDFGPTLASEYLADRHDTRVSRETLRGWMIEAEMWKPRRARVERVHVWRQRRAQYGELVQWDTSEHHWLEKRGEKLYLILMIDDATSRAMGRFVRHDSTEENLRTLRAYLKRYGRPLAVYTDKASLFKINRAPRIEEQLQAEQPKTQIGRALGELGIEWIAAHSPQAKGRVERFFGTAQDRLVKGLRKAGACTLEDAQRYLDRVYLPLWNRRFTASATNPTDAHRPLGSQHDLAAILSQVESRVIADDYTFRFQAVRYQIVKEQVRPGLRGASVRVEKRLDGKLMVRFRDTYLTVQRCEATLRQTVPKPRLPTKKPPVPSRPHNWMEDFDLQRSKPIWAVLDPPPHPRRNIDFPR